MRKAPSILAMALFAVPSFAAELELRYGALEHILAEQVFTQDGRRYVRGNRDTKCQFAYLEMPHIGAENGRLHVTARFSGRTAFDLFGRCIGLGDSFDLAITATPFPRDGSIALKDVSVATVRDSYYIRRVRAALTQSIAKDLKIEVREQAKKLLEQPGDPPSPSPFVYQRQVSAFDLSDIRVLPDALLLVVEFRLVVK